MKSILSAFVVSFGLISVRSNNQTNTEAKTGFVRGRSEVQENFRNFFDSITKNDVKKSGTYRNILEQETRNEQRAFHTMKEDVRSARQRNVYKENRNFHIKNDNIGAKAAAFKRETSDSDGPRKLNFADRIFKPGEMEPYPINLADLGFDGSWEKFCSEEDIFADQPEFPEHDLRRMRLSICWLRGKSSLNYLHPRPAETKPNELTAENVKIFAIFKYCMATRHTFDDFLMQFTDKLSLGDPEKRAHLLDPESRPNRTECYDQTLATFHKTCAGEANPCTKMLKLLLARGCEAPWLTTQTILSDIDKICAGKWVTDDIPWEAIFHSISYKPQE